MVCGDCVMDIFSYLSDRNSFSIIVRTNAPETKIVKWDPEKTSFRVDVAAPPEDNKANIELIKFFTRLLKKDVRIIRGATSKQKILRAV